MIKEKPSTAVTPQKHAPPSTAPDYGSDAGAGFENQSNDDVKIPFLNVLQAGSPQVENSETLKPGMLYNTITGEGYKSVLFVPGITQHKFIEFVPREKGGGGFRGEHSPSDPLVLAAKKASTKFGDYTLPNGNELTETFSLFGVIMNEDGTPGILAAISCASMKIKPYKDINTMIRLYQYQDATGRRVSPPLFANVLKVGTKPDSKNGKNFFNITFCPAKGSIAASLIAPDNAAYQAAKAVQQLVLSGAAKVDYAKAEAPTVETDERDPGWNKA